MILPQTYLAALILTIVSMICWGSWANTQKLTGDWRFELYYFDFAFGVFLAATVAAFTLGTIGDNLSFLDNLAISGKTQIAYGLAAGAIFNLANMLLVAAVSIAGLSVAFPIGIGIAMVIGVVLNYFLSPQGNPLLLFSGLALVLGAVVADAFAYQAQDKLRDSKEKPAVPAVAAPKAKVNPLAAPRREEKKNPTMGILLSILSGILMGLFYPVLQLGAAGEIGLKPYAMAFIFSIGVLLSTFVYNLYFMNLPIRGRAISYISYFFGTRKQHLLGILGGIIWCAGALANFAAASAPEEVQVGPAVSYGLGQGATMVSVLWGLLVWKEFAGANGRVKQLLATMFGLFLVGLTLISLAPLFVKH